MGQGDCPCTGQVADNRLVQGWNDYKLPGIFSLKRSRPASQDFRAPYRWRNRDVLAGVMASETCYPAEDKAPGRGLDCFNTARSACGCDDAA